MPDARIIDGVDQKDFFYGKSEQSARDGFVLYVGEDIFGTKWRNWKMLTKEYDDARGTARVVEYGVPRFYNLYNDPQEAYAITMKFPEHLWVRWPMAQIMREHLASFKAEPPIKAGTPDPYLPPGGGNGESTMTQ